MYSSEQTRHLQDLSKTLLQKISQKNLNRKDLSSLRQVLVFHEHRYYILSDPLITDTSAYYGANYARLVRVKAKYDPSQVFRFPQGVPPV